MILLVWQVGRALAPRTARQQLAVGHRPSVPEPLWLFWLRQLVTLLSCLSEVLYTTIHHLATTYLSLLLPGPFPHLVSWTLTFGGFDIASHLRNIHYLL